MFTRNFWLDLTERAVKTFAQAVLGVLIVSSTIAHLKWGPILDAGGLAAAVSVLTSVVGTSVGAPDSGSWLPKHADPPQPTAQAGYTLIGLLVLITALILVAVGAYLLIIGAVVSHVLSAPGLILLIIGMVLAVVGRHVDSGGRLL